MLSEIEVGKLLKLTREDANLTQEEMGFRLNYDASVVSKLENGYMGLKLSICKEWFSTVNREDIFIMLLSGIDPKAIMETVFTDEYKEKLGDLKNKPIDPKVIEKYSKMMPLFDEE